MKLHNIEFIGTFSGQVEIRCMDTTPYMLEPKHRDFVRYFIQLMKNKWTQAYYYYADLYLKYIGNIVHYEFLIVRGSIKCNFANYDGVPDIDSEGNFHFEIFFCPRFGECTGHKIACCFPKETTSLTKCEIDVLQLIARGYTAEEIGEKLYRSPKTVHNQTTSMLRKINVHNNAGLTSYYYDHIKQPTL